MQDFACGAFRRAHLPTSRSRCRRGLRQPLQRRSLRRVGRRRRRVGRRRPPNGRGASTHRRSSAAPPPRAPSPTPRARRARPTRRGSGARLARAPPRGLALAQPRRRHLVARLASFNRLLARRQPPSRSASAAARRACLRRARRRRCRLARGAAARARALLRLERLAVDVERRRLRDNLRLFAAQLGVAHASTPPPPSPPTASFAATAASRSRSFGSAAAASPAATRTPPPARRPPAPTPGRQHGAGAAAAAPSASANCTGRGATTSTSSAAGVDGDPAGRRRRTGSIYLGVVLTGLPGLAGRRGHPAARAASRSSGVIERNCGGVMWEARWRSGRKVIGHLFCDESQFPLCRRSRHARGRRAIRASTAGELAPLRPGAERRSPRARMTRARAGAGQPRRAAFGSARGPPP